MTKRTPRAVTLLVAISVLGATGIAGATSWMIGLTSAAQPAQSQSAAINPPTGGSATSLTSTSLLISWSAPSTGARPSGYTITRDGSSVPSGSGCFGTITTTSCTDSGLAAQTTYTYTVSAVVGSHWTSNASSSFQGTTASVVTVTVSGSQTYGGSPSFTYTTSPSGVTVSSLSCTEVSPSTPISSTLAVGSYTILGSSCTGSAGSNYSLSFTGAASGFVVNVGQLHISALTGSGTSSGWNGTVTVTVDNAAGTPVNGVAVTGSWTPTKAASPSGCTTTGAGQCAITTTSNFPSAQQAETWTVSNLSLSGYTYNSSANVESSFTVSEGCSSGSMCASLLIGETATSGVTGYDDAVGGTIETPTLSSTDYTPLNSTVLLLIYRESEAASDSVTFTSGTADNTAFTSPTLIKSNSWTATCGTTTPPGNPTGSASCYYNMWAYEATGTGTSGGTVDLTFTQDNVRTDVEVIVLSGDDNSAPVVSGVSGTAIGTGTTATATLSSATSGDAEFDMLLVSYGTTGGWTWPPTPSPGTFSTVDQHTSSGSPWYDFSYTTYLGTPASTSESSTLASSEPWGTIAFEVAHS